jgi:hypothetical protein
MLAIDDSIPAIAPASTPPHQGIRNAARSRYYQNDVAQRHHDGSTLSEARTGRAASLTEIENSP